MEASNCGINIKNPSIEEIDEILRVENESWPPNLAFTIDHFMSQIKTFREGMLCAYIDNEMVGMFITEIIKYKPHRTLQTWYGASDDGFIEHTHTLEGNALYGVSLGVSKNYRCKGVGKELVKSAIKYSNFLGLDYFVLGSRVPFYHMYYRIPIEKYILMDIDPQLLFYRKCGLKIIKPLPNYFIDPDSLDYGVLMIHENNCKE